MVKHSDFVRFKFQHFTLTESKKAICVDQGVIIVPSQPCFNGNTLETGTCGIAFFEICDYLGIQKKGSSSEFSPYEFIPQKRRDSSLKREWKKKLSFGDRGDYVIVTTKLTEALHKRDKKEWGDYSDALDAHYSNPL